jgi:hypothetical protein
MMSVCSTGGTNTSELSQASARVNGCAGFAGPIFRAGSQHMNQMPVMLGALFSDVVWEFLRGLLRKFTFE